MIISQIITKEITRGRRMLKINNMEIWKDIKNFDNYQVSNFGRVKRKSCAIVYKNGNLCHYKEKLLKQDIVKGYMRVTLSQSNIQKRFLVHRLVAEYFIIKVEGKNCVNHLNGIKTDNNLYNLEWCTYSENEKHSHRILNKIPSCSKMVVNTQNGIFYNNITEAAKSMGLKVTTLSANLSGKTKCNKTYFRYA